MANNFHLIGQRSAIGTGCLESSIFSTCQIVPGFEEKEARVCQTGIGKHGLGSFILDGHCNDAYTLDLT